jgi:hypothetical protein
LLAFAAVREAFAGIARSEDSFAGNGRSEEFFAGIGRCEGGFADFGRSEAPSPKLRAIPAIESSLQPFTANAVLTAAKASKSSRAVTDAGKSACAAAGSGAMP